MDNIHQWKKWREKESRFKTVLKLGMFAIIMPNVPEGFTNNRAVTILTLPMTTFLGSLCLVTYMVVEWWEGIG